MGQQINATLSGSGYSPLRPSQPAVSGGGYSSTPVLLGSVQTGQVCSKGQHHKGPKCVTSTCDGVSYNGKPGQRCRRSCSEANPCVPRAGHPVVSQNQSVPRCVTSTCDGVSYNGAPGERCRRSCSEANPGVPRAGRPDSSQKKGGNARRG